MRRANTYVVASLAALLTAAICYAGTVVDQGAPGRQGPWPVYCVTSTTTLFSKANHGFSLTPGSIAGHAVYTSVQTLSGSIVGASCGIGVPAGFDSADLVPTCLAGAGTVTIYIYNTTAGALTATPGTYTTVVW